MSGNAGNAEDDGKVTPVISEQPGTGVKASGMELSGEYYIVTFRYVQDFSTVAAGTALYVTSDDIPYYTEDGDYLFIADEAAAGCRLGELPIYYKGGFENKEWFKKYVLNLEEAEYDSFPIRVITKTAKELTEQYATEGVLPAYDFLYLNDGSYRDADAEEAAKAVKYNTADCDLSESLCMQLFKDAVAGQKPCLVDGGILFQSTGEQIGMNTALQDTNMFKLCAMFCKESPNEYFSTYNGTAPEEGKVLYDSIKKDVDKNFVTEHVYCVYTDSSVFHKDFYNPVIYKEGGETIQEGFEDVLSEIEVENLYRSADSSTNVPRLSTNISQAEVLRHIINYRSKRSGESKQSIRVLEIQPAKTNTPRMTLEVLKKWVPGLQTADVTCMTTAEFIGKVETLNDRYDLIYIGTAKDHLNTVKASRAAAEAEGSTVFNDSSMNGLIYYHTGDVRYAGMELAGQLDTDYVGGSRANSLYYYNALRYGGNDITKEKLQALNSFLDGSYPVVLSDEFFEAPVTFYEDINYGGYSASLNVGEYTTADLRKQGMNEADASSLKVREGYRITCYEGDNFTGNSVVFTADNSSLLTVNGANWNDRIRSVKVELIEGANPVRQVDQDHIDNCSYLYEFADSALKQGRTNFYAYSDMEQDNRLFQFYLNRPKAELYNTGANGTLTNGIYAVYPDLNGRYSLEYHFTIANQGAASADTRYQCDFYIDVNADGKFSPQEALADIQLTAGGNSVNTTDLRAGVEYVLRRTVPDGYKGVLPWKIQVSQVSNPNIYCHMDGYTKLKGLEKETVKILQISRDQVFSPEWWGGRNERFFSLAEQINGKRTIYEGDGSAYSSDQAGSAEDSWKGIYYKLVYGDGTAEYPGIADDFDIDATFMTISHFEKLLRAGQINMDDYNMLILGFSDAYGEFSGDASNPAEPMGAIVSFLDSGKSVLFAHDTTSYFNYEKGKQGVVNSTTGELQGTNQYHNAYSLNQYIRDLVGMDRYGIMSMAMLKSGRGLNSSSGEWSSLLASGKDIAYQPKSNRTVMLPQTQGYTYSIINAKDKHAESDANVSSTYYTETESRVSGGFRNTYLNLNYGTVYYSDPGEKDSWIAIQDNGEIPLNYNAEVTNLWVTQVNKGQITEYPYHLSDTFKVTKTHGQYYQLDFNADDDQDGQSDLVVWYCLGDRTTADGTHQETIYSMSPNDVSNNYYIYSKGNITYTGMGHAGIDSRDALDEAKLFINTMIASYQAGIRNPGIKILEEGSADAAQISVEYRYQDEANDLLYEEYDGSYEKVFFTVWDNNFVKGSRRISVKAYYEVNSPEGSVTLVRDGQTHYLKAFDLSAVSFYDAATGGQVDPSQLNSGGVYYMLLPKSMMGNYESYSIYLEAQSILQNRSQTYETGKVYTGLEFIRTYLFDIT